MENIYVLTSSTIPASKLSTELKRVKQASRREIKTSKPSLNNASIALVYLDKRDSNPLNAIIQIKLKWPEMAVVYIGHKITFKLPIELMRVGLSDYLTQPVTQEDIDDSVERICLRMKVLRFDPEHYKLLPGKFRCAIC
ncbi:hypothetical protein ICN10_09905 [Polynucleobacter sp. 86C-FISCH]|uniref:hypothetical protein n=1 Tax=Polynucleobacter sp. 86C-FISCH TaxID=2689101 RepID=UPI001C0BB510|nr:hypothetical protein [Polynucleobacter sp. 86C-FISCH]MBU3596712.1 hypothetical protein [Polynucleobacter sp. 86C-FISCH]